MYTEKDLMVIDELVNFAVEMILEHFDEMNKIACEMEERDTLNAGTCQDNNDEKVA